MERKLLGAQVEDDLMAYILNTPVQIGEKLPNEFELGEMFQVGRSTVREAVKSLVTKGILEVRRGDGTYVKSHCSRAEDPLGLCGTSFSPLGEKGVLFLRRTDCGRRKERIMKCRNFLVCLAAAALMTGFAVWAAGIIGFVGLVVPHVVRMLFGTDHRRLVPLSALTGGLFLLWADVLCQVILPGSELPVGILTSMLGAPVFLWLMARSRYHLSTWKPTAARWWG